MPAPAVLLFGTVVEVRDVLESFLRDRVLVDDWRERLVAASERFIELGVGSADNDIAQLGERVAALARSGLTKEPAATRSVAAEVERLLDQVHVPQLPRPEDEDWGF